MTRIMLFAVVTAFVSMASAFVLKSFADAVFLAEFGVEYVPHFFVGQAILLVSSSAAYGHVIKRGAKMWLDVVILLVLAGACFAAPVAVRSGGWMLFAAALALVALSALATMALWNAVTSIVSGRSARAFLPRAGAAATGGAIFGGFGASGIVSLTSVDFLAPVAGGLAVLAIFLRLALKQRVRPTRKMSAQMRADAITKEESSKSVRRLVMLLALATIVEAVLSAVIDYGFKKEVDEAFSGGEKIGLFFSLYYGSTNVLLLLTQLFFASKLLATRSLKFSLSAQPAVLAGIGLLWTFAPVLALGALCRGSENILKFGIARPAQEVALTPLRENSRKRWKILLRGVFAQGGAALAGIVLIVLAPLFDLHPAVVPGFVVLLAGAWWLLQRKTGEVYRQTLSSALGLRRHEPAEQTELALDRDGLAALLASADQPNAAPLSHGLLQELCPNTAALPQHLAELGENGRRVVYRTLSSQPAKGSALALRKSVSDEAPESPAARDGLLALAAIADPEGRDAAQSILASGDPDALWVGELYLATLGDFDGEPEKLREVLDNSLTRDGASAARLLEFLCERGALESDAAAEIVLSAIDDAPHTAALLQSLAAAGAFEHERLLSRLVNALEQGLPGVGAALSLLNGERLARLAEILESKSPSIKSRCRFVIALRTLDMPEVTRVVTPYLLDESAEVRASAAHTLSRQIRRGHPRPPAKTVARALETQLGRFELYIAARPGFTAEGRESNIEITLRQAAGTNLSDESFFLDELERATETCLQRLTDILALFGEPATVYAAQRALRAPSFKRRRQALDLMQEIVGGRQRKRLLAALERYLLPPPTPQAGAREAVCEIDPWLEKCRTGTLDPDRKLWALRAAELFDRAPGEAVLRLTKHAEVSEYAKGGQVVRKGEAGDSLFIVMDGAVAVKNGDTTLAQLASGESFGELSLLDENPRGADVVALVDCKLLKLPRAPFQAALDTYPELGLGVVSSLSKMLRRKAGDVA